MKNMLEIVTRFPEVGEAGAVKEVRPLGSGLINDTFLVVTDDVAAPDYVLQRINHSIFKDVDMLQDNIEAVTAKIRETLECEGCKDIDRRVLRFVPSETGKTYYFDGENYWRLMEYIVGSETFDSVEPEYARLAGEEFGRFQSMLTSLAGQLGETIPGFHNMEMRLRQLREAVAADPVGRVKEVEELLKVIESRADCMCFAEKLHREGKLPKRVCHCDTKVNNMLFDKETGKVLCVIDLDTVMPSYIFSDFGDFLRTAASTRAEDDPDYDGIDFRFDVFKAFAEGYLRSASSFLTPVEIENIPTCVEMFPYMQAVRFLTDYINGDIYYNIKYPTHNLVRTLNQIRLLEKVESRHAEMAAAIAELVAAQS